MVLKLDPRLPLVWRTPTSMQFGVDSPAVVLDNISNAAERMIAALVSGVSQSGLEMIARDAGAAAFEAQSLIAAIRPALHAPDASALGSVTISGTGSTADSIAASLTNAGVLVAGDSDDLGLAIIVSHYVIEPELHGRWLRRDIPHLPVVYGDAVVRVGPIVEPGSGPCLFCLELYRRDDDPSWPAIASQLWGRRSEAETAIVAGEIAAVAARMALARLRQGAGSATSVHLDAGSGAITRQSWGPHPECECVEVL
jgi:hypothetical protein